LPIPFSGTPSAEIHLLLDCRISWEKHVYRRLSLSLTSSVPCDSSSSPVFSLLQTSNSNTSETHPYHVSPSFHVLFSPSHWLSFFLSFFRSPFVLLNSSSPSQVYTKSGLSFFQKQNTNTQNIHTRESMQQEQLYLLIAS
jgi:hypothetical protein